MVVMEGTQSDQIGAVALELDTPGLGQPLKGEVLLESFQFRVGMRVIAGFSLKSCQYRDGFSLHTC